MYEAPGNAREGEPFSMSRWISACFYGGALGGVLSLAFALFFRGSVILSDLGWVLLCVIVYSAQAQALRPHLGARRPWIIAGVGAAVLWVVLINLYALQSSGSRGSSPSLLITLRSIAIIYLIKGSAQWLVLRRHFRGAGWWLPVCVAGALAAGVLGGLAQLLLAGLAPISLLDLVLMWTLVHATFWGICGVPQALLLRWLWARRRVAPGESEEEAPSPVLGGEV